MVSHSFPSFVRDLCIYLGKAGYSILVFAPIKSDADFVSLEYANVAYHYLGHRGRLTSHSVTQDFYQKPRFEMIRYFLTVLMKTIVLCKRNRIDVVHGHWVLPSGLICAVAGKLLRIPSVITAHGRCIRYNPAADQTLPSHLYIRLGIRIASRLASKVVVCSRDSTEHARKVGIPSEKIAVVQNGISLETFTTTADPAPVRNRFAPAGEKIILSVASLRRVKGLDYLIRAMYRVGEKMPAVRLLIVGEGPKKRELSEMISSLGLQNHVVLLGQLDNQDLPPYYCAADVVVIPSLDEGFGVVALEAMSSGKPIIATSVGGLQEIVNTKNGFVVPPADSETLAVYILAALENQKMARMMGKKGRRFVEKELSWTISTRKFSLLYSNLMGVKS